MTNKQLIKTAHAVAVALALLALACVIATAQRGVGG